MTDDVFVVAAIVYTLLAGVVVVFQLALAAGAPWGEFSMGGRFPGKYPGPMRGVAVLSAVVVALMAAIVLSQAGFVLPVWREVSRWAVWVVVGYSALALVMNLATPSKGERALWAPVAAVMLVCSAMVALS